MFVLAVAMTVPEGAVTFFLTGARAAFGFAGGGLTAVVGKVSNIAYGNKIMSQKKINCWKENFSSELRNLQAGNGEGSQQLRKETDSILNKISSEAKKLPMDEFPNLTEEVKNLNKWSEKLKGIIFDLKETKRKFEELQQT